MSFTSWDVCFEIEAFLLKALGQTRQRFDVHVKLKALRALKHLCEKGNPELRTSLRRKASVVKAFVTYTADPDPLHGDSLIKQVRVEAEKCIGAIYGDEAFSRQKQLSTSGADFSGSQFYCYSPSAESKPRGVQVDGSDAFSSERRSNLSLWSEPQQQYPVSSSLYGHDERPVSFSDDTLKRITNSTVQQQCSSSDGRYQRNLYGKMEGFGNPYFTSSTPKQDSLRSSLPAVSNISDVMATQAGQLVLGLSQAASTVSKFIPQSVKAQLDSITDKIPLPTSLSTVTSSTHFGSSHQCNPYTFSSASQWEGSPIAPTTYTGQGKTCVDFSDRFRFSGPTSSSHLHGPTTASRGSSNSVPSSLPAPALPTPPAMRSQQGGPSWNSGFVPPNGDTLSQSTEAFQVIQRPSAATQNGCRNPPNCDDVASLFLLTELVESTSELPMLGPASIADFVRRCENHPQSRDVVPLLLCKLFPAIGSSIAPRHSVVPASTWKAKQRVLALLAALLKPAAGENTTSSFRETCALQIRDNAAPYLSNLYKTAPKCRTLIDEVMHRSGLPPCDSRSHSVTTVNLLDGEDHESGPNSNVINCTRHTTETDTSTDLLHINGPNELGAPATDLDCCRNKSEEDKKSTRSQVPEDAAFFTLLDDMVDQPKCHSLKSVDDISHNLLDLPGFDAADPAQLAHTTEKPSAYDQQSTQSWKHLPQDQQSHVTSCLFEGLSLQNREPPRRSTVTDHPQGEELSDSLLIHKIIPTQSGRVVSDTLPSATNCTVACDLEGSLIPHLATLPELSQGNANGSPSAPENNDTGNLLFHLSEGLTTTVPTTRHANLTILKSPTGAQPTRSLFSFVN